MKKSLLIVIISLFYLPLCAQSANDVPLKVSYGSPMVLNTMAGAVNCMVENEYVFAQSYTLSTGNQNVNRCLLKRK